MKQTKNKVIPVSDAYRHYRRRYPNCADPHYFLDKILDGLLALATGMGTVTIFFFLITM